MDALEHAHRILAGKEPSMWIELDEDVWPERKSLVGLLFATAEEFERAKALLPFSLLDMYREVYQDWRMLVVRKTDAHVFHEAGLSFEEIEQLDDADLPPEEVRERNRELIAYWKPIMLERHRRKE